MSDPIRHQSAVYPRWRGEHGHLQRIFLDRGGLSPLARGTQFLGFDKKIGLRFIPAGAGNTTGKMKRLSAISVYPRWRGEHPDSQPACSNRFGLSPLARGTRSGDACLSDCVRFIPAGAGNTISSVCRKAAGTVYPRWRGEHAWLTLSLMASFGLSPLARGTHHYDYSDLR